MDPLSDPSISPYKVRSITRALNANGVEDAAKTTAANTGTIATRLNTLHTDLQKTNELLQELLDK